MEALQEGNGVQATGGRVGQPGRGQSRERVARAVEYPCSSPRRGIMSHTRGTTDQVLKSQASELPGKTLDNGHSQSSPNILI